MLITFRFTLYIRKKFAIWFISSTTLQIEKNIPKIFSVLDGNLGGMLHKYTLAYLFVILLIFSSAWLSVTNLLCSISSQVTRLTTLIDRSFQNTVLSSTQFLLCLEWFRDSLLFLFKIICSELWVIGELTSQYRMSQEILNFASFWQNALPYHLQALFLLPLFLMFLLIFYFNKRLHLLELAESDIRHVQLYLPFS